MMENLRAQGMRLKVYLDDILLMEQCPTHLSVNQKEVLTLLENLEFVINAKKSMLTPLQRVTFLGFDRLGGGNAESTILEAGEDQTVLRKTLVKPTSSLRQIARVVICHRQFKRSFPDRSIPGRCNDYRRTIFDAALLTLKLSPSQRRPRRRFIGGSPTWRHGTGG